MVQILPPKITAGSQFGAGLGQGLADVAKIGLSTKLNQMLQDKQEAKQDKAIHDYAEQLAKIDGNEDRIPLYFAAGKVGGVQAIESLFNQTGEQKSLMDMHLKQHREMGQQGQGAADQQQVGQQDMNAPMIAPQYREAQGEAQRNPFEMVPSAATPLANGILSKGNINLNSRPRVKNANGTISTVKSKSFNIDGKEVLLPTVSDDGKIMTDQEALKQYFETGKHLGIFTSPEEATKYAIKLHNNQENLLNRPDVPRPDQNYRVAVAGQDSKGNQIFKKIPRSIAAIQSPEDLENYKWANAHNAKEAEHIEAEYRGERQARESEKRNVTAEKKANYQMEKDQRDYVKQVNKSYEATLRKKPIYKLMEEKAGEIKPMSVYRKYLSERWGAPPGTVFNSTEQVLDKMGNQLLQGVASSFDQARILQTEVESYIKANPSLLNTPEGMQFNCRKG